MDNVSVHGLETLQDTIIGVGAIIPFLPYSPNLNPIEEYIFQGQDIPQNN